MKVIVCEMCEGHDFLKEGGIYICQSCGAKYSVEEAKKLMQEVEGAAPSQAATAAANANKDLEKYLLLARRAKDSGNSADAAKYYSMAQTEDPNSWECAYFNVYFTAMQTNIANISSAANLVTNCLPSVVGLIKNHTPESEQPAAVKELLSKTLDIGIMLKNAAVNHYNNTDASIRANYTSECNGRVQAVRNMLYILGDSLEAAFSAKPFAHASIAAAWLGGLAIDENYFKGQMASNIETYYNKVYKYDANSAKTYFRKRIDQLEVQNRNLSSTTHNNGCMGAFMFFLAALFFLLYSVVWESDEDLMFVLVFAGFCALIGVICYIPKKYSPEKLAERQAAIEKNNRTIAQMRSRLGE